MVQIHFITAGVEAIVAGYNQMGADMPAKIEKLTRHHGQLLRTRVMANASGRPGPNTPTGDYRRSISLKVEKKGLSTSAYVGTNLPQGRRLEYGFHGVDSIGRTYNQPPYPHFGPAFDQQEPEFITAAEALLRWVV